LKAEWTAQLSEQKPRMTRIMPMVCNHPLIRVIRGFYFADSEFSPKSIRNSAIVFYSVAGLLKWTVSTGFPLPLFSFDF
jgi:hypothetical protein